MGGVSLEGGRGRRKKASDDRREGKKARGSAEQGEGGVGSLCHKIRWQERAHACFETGLDATALPTPKMEKNDLPDQGTLQEAD